MEIRKITQDKKKYLDLLLLADEQESMIDRYLSTGEMFVLFHPDVTAVCVVVKKQEGVCEIKNLAVKPEKQRKGYGRQMIDFVFDHYHPEVLLVGTGDSPLTIPFYQRCGFSEAYRVKNFFLDNYDHPIFEAGVQLVDMVYLKKQRS